MSELAPGTRVDRYEVVRELGQGGMAVVYEARHIELGSRHALKVLWPGPPQVADRLVQEGRVQAKLSHPNIVSVTDVVVVDGRPGLILEFVDGVPLDDWLGARPTTDDSTRRRIACQILSAVAYAHASGTIHRDLKPANVLVSGGDGPPWAKVADFGLAKWLHDADAGGTRTGVAMGTPRYMAPEQIRDAKHVNERADVFALGCILAELWGKPAFQGTSIPEVFERIVSGKFDVPANAPTDVAAAIRGALQPDQTKRTQSVAEMMHQLQCADPPPRTVAPVAAIPRARWWLAGLGGGAALGAALVGLLLLVACVGGVWLSQPTTPVIAAPVAATPPSPAPTPLQGRSRPRRPPPVASPSPAPVPSPAPAPSPARPAPAPGNGGDKDDDKDEKEEKGKGKGKD